MKHERQSLTSRQLAEVLGVSESSVKRWVDEGTIAADRTAGGHRRIPLAAAMGFIRQQRATLAKPHLLPLEATPQIGSIDSHAVEALHDALRHDQPMSARSIIAGRFLGGAGIASIGDGLIRPVMERLGELWHHDPEGILLEHRAIDTCVLALAEIGSWLPALPAAAPSAVAAGGSDDPYQLPPMLASLVLCESGIHAHNLGAFTPLETVGMAMNRYGARFCSISISAAPSARTEAAWLAFERATAEAGGRIVVGGRCSGALPAKVRERVQLCGSMSELGAYATGWLEGVRRNKPRKGAGP
jgi:excisionase family DNA binding protein